MRPTSHLINPRPRQYLSSRGLGLGKSEESGRGPTIYATRHDHQITSAQAPGEQYNLIPINETLCIDSIRASLKQYSALVYGPSVNLPAATRAVLQTRPVAMPLPAADDVEDFVSEVDRVSQLVNSLHDGSLSIDDFDKTHAYELKQEKLKQEAAAAKASNLEKERAEMEARKKGAKIKV